MVASRVYSGRGSIRSIHQWVASCVITRDEIQAEDACTRRAGRVALARASRVPTVHWPARRSPATAGFSSLLPGRGKLECRLLPPFHRGQPRFFPPSRAYTTHIVCRTRACAVCPILARGINHNVEGQGRTSRASFQLSSNFNLRGVFIYFEECTFFFFFLIGGR